MDAVFYITANGPQAEKAAGILKEELTKRGASLSAPPAYSLELEENAGFDNNDIFENTATGTGMRFRANGVRGLIYAIGLFLRKTEIQGKTFSLCADITGKHAPKKAIRGHQLGYRPCSNTYDAWMPDQFARYMTQLMFFGMNTVEFIPFTEQNALMRYSGPEMTRILSETAHSLGLEVSLWIPNTEKDEAEELAEREALFRDVPFIDAVFIPGSDPGSLPASVLIDRCNKIYDILHKYHPAAKLWPSAQAPHNAPRWGEEFLQAMEHAGPGIAGVITGPNRAFDIDELRRRLPKTYPIRFYPDITHNLRCEHPVHFETDDWHYAFSTALSRESINPRPAEYKRLFQTISPYTVGSVTYSDGINDDVNKAVWCALEWDDTLTAADIAEDYARAYLYDYDIGRVSALILLLEKNWEGSPLEKRVDFSLYTAEGLKKERNCWRFTQLYFRALCDKYIKERLLADTAAVGLAKALTEAGDLAGAKTALAAERPSAVTELRRRIAQEAKQLFDTAGMQLSVKEYGASGWERGATLDTLDLPVSDREWLLHVLETAPDRETVLSAMNRNDVGEKEYYFSLALNGLASLGTEQEKDFYMNFQGDRPDVNNGALPVCLQKVFDHFSFKARLAGFDAGADHDLTVTYLKPDERFLETHTIRVNGTRLSAPVKNAKLAQPLLPPQFCAYTYRIPAAALPEGKIELEISEPVSGFQIAEFRITHREENV